MLPASVEGLPNDPEVLELWIEEQENDIGNLKESARAYISWAQPEHKKKTDHAIVYLHGFSASHGEGHPTHVDIAETFGCNLYLARLHDHGITAEQALERLTPDSLIKSAVGALSIGKKIGKKVIIMGTSTGASLGLYLAAHKEFREHVAGLILYSPLIRFYGRHHWLLGNRASRALLRAFPGHNYAVTSDIPPGEQQAIWYNSYRLRGVINLARFIHEHMTEETFSRVACPAFTGYYYKNEEEQDKVVSVKAIKRMHEQLGTETDRKVLRNFPEAASHVISSGMLCRSIDRVKEETSAFLQNKMSLKTAKKW